MLTYLIFGITYGFIAGVQPGPFQTYIISQTLKRGLKRTLPAAVAPIISDVPIIILVVFILNTIPEENINMLRISGGVFLIYLAINAFKSWKKFSYNENIDPSSKNKTLYNAVIVNLLNPNPYLSWGLIMGPLFLVGWSEEPIYGVSLIISFYFTFLFFLVLTIILFAFARKLGPQVNKALLGLSSIALFLFGLYQLLIGIAYFY